MPFNPVFKKWQVLRLAVSLSVFVCTEEAPRPGIRELYPQLYSAHDVKYITTVLSLQLT